MEQNDQETNTHDQLPEDLTDFEKRQLIWEENHEKIAEAIRYMQRKDITITAANIAKATNLSRKTIYKHLAQDDIQLSYKTSTQVNKFMMDDVITRLCRKACFGDIQAAKLYLELMGAIKPAGNNTINANLVNNNKAIMVNGHVFSEEMVKKLSPENLNQLEEFVKAAEMSSSREGLQNAPNIYPKQD